MIGAFILQTVVYLMTLLLFWLPDATTLPTIASFDIDSALLTVFSQIRAILGLIPPLQVIYDAFIWYYGIMLLLVVLGWIKWAYGAIRGSGS